MTKEVRKLSLKIFVLMVLLGSLAVLSLTDSTRPVYANACCSSCMPQFESCAASCNLFYTPESPEWEICIDNCAHYEYMCYNVPRCNGTC